MTTADFGGAPQDEAAGHDDPVGAPYGFARDVATSPALEALVRPLLGALAKIGGFDATYLTTIDWDVREQEVRYAHNVSGVQVREQHSVHCSPDLLEQRFLGAIRSNDLAAAQPDDHLARDLGLVTYVSVPVLTLDHRLLGTLCAASPASRDIAEDPISVMECFAALIANHVTCEEAGAARHRIVIAEERLRERAMFLAEAEHKLKTPLTVITGFAAMLRQSGPDMSEVENTLALEMIERNAAVLADQIDHLVEEAMGEVKARDQRPERTRVREVLQTIGIAFAAVAGGRDVHVEVADDVWVFVDPAVLDQVLGHLLDNAVKYSPRATPLWLRAVVSAGWVEVDVTDHGCGIPTDIDVFVAFQRGVGDAVRTKPGVGLGLHIVRNLTHAMGGDVSARRNAGGGSTLTLRLPAA